MRSLFLRGLLAAVLAGPAAAAPDPKKAAPPDGPADIADKLTERTDLDRFDRVPLRVALEVLQDKLGYSILLDYKPLLSALGEEEGNQKALDERVVHLPAMKKVRLETILRHVLDQIDADFYIAPDHVLVTTPAVRRQVMGPDRVVRDLPGRDYPDSPLHLAEDLVTRHTPAVTVAFRDVPAADALKVVAARAGASVVIAADAAAQARTNVTVSVANVSIESAVSAIAEAAGLRAYRAGKVLVVVGPERVKAIEGPSASPPGGSLDVGFSSGRTVTVEELEAIARLFPQARPAARRTEADGLRKEVERLAAERQGLEERLKKLEEAQKK